MPFLPPNQQRQSTEGHIRATGLKSNMIWETISGTSKKHCKEGKDITGVYTKAEKTTAASICNESAITDHVCNEDHVTDRDSVKAIDRVRTRQDWQTHQGGSIDQQKQQHEPRKR